MADMPTEGVTLSGARWRVRTKNRCGSGESQIFEYRRCKVITDRISQVKGQRTINVKHAFFIDTYFLELLNFSTALFYLTKEKRFIIMQELENVLYPIVVKSMSIYPVIF
jgi:hypothetical protein